MATVDRLSSPSAFRAVFQNGRSYAEGSVVAYVAKRTNGTGPARAGFVVSRKVGGAVARNRAKRLLREALRLEGRELPEGLDLVLIARPSVATASYHDVASDLRKILAAAGMGGGTG
jgi:ribonuclease P protein component